MLSRCRQRWNDDALATDAEGRPLDENLHRLTRFLNPDETNPVLIERFLSYLDLQRILPTVLKYYAHPWKIRFLGPMLKTIFAMVLHKITSPEKIIAFYQQHPEAAAALGYKRRADGSVVLPSGQLLRHNLLYRFGQRGLDEFFERMEAEVRQEAGRLGLQIYNDSAGDGTPLEAASSDREAEYNGHYEVRGYKVVTLTTREEMLPLAKLVQPINHGEAPPMIHMVQRVVARGVPLEIIRLDGAYSGFESLAIHVGAFGLRIWTKPLDQWVWHPEATEEELRRRYQQYHEEPLFRVDAPFESVMKFLVVHGNDGDRDCVGQWVRNQLMDAYVEDREGYLKECHQRSREESFNNHLKHDYGLVRWQFRHPGIAWANRATTMVYLTMVAVAWTRLQNGIKRGLTSVGGLA